MIEKSCGTCDYCLRTKDEQGNIKRIDCAMDGHYMGYVETFDYGCYKWRKDYKLAIEEERKKIIEEFKDLGKLYSEIRAEERQKVIEEISEELDELWSYYDNDYCSDNKDSMWKCYEVREILDKLKGK